MKQDRKPLFVCCSNGFSAQPWIPSPNGLSETTMVSLNTLSLAPTMCAHATRTEWRQKKKLFTTKRWKLCSQSLRWKDSLSLSRPNSGCRKTQPWLIVLKIHYMLLLWYFENAAGATMFKSEPTSNPCEVLWMTHFKKVLVKNCRRNTQVISFVKYLYQEHISHFSPKPLK